MKWGNMTGFDEINKVLSDAYNEVLKFNKNMFKVPYGRIGKSVVTETCKLITLYNENANWESLALKAVFIFLPLVLQKPSKTSKTKDHKGHLERRVDLWQKGLIKQLVKEANAIQKRMFFSKKVIKQNIATRHFAI